MAETIQRFDRNMAGKDYVVGDIHGCFDQLESALAGAGFYPEQDRLFSVGDLIDRGPASEDALSWLAKPWFHAVLGNHEEMALTSGQDRENMFWWVMLNGGLWWPQLESGRQQQYLQVFSALPLVIEIETEMGRVGIVHADVPAGLDWGSFVQALTDGDDSVREIAIWGRARAEGRVKQLVAGIDRVVCGHTITIDGQVHVVGNVWFIDTGAFLQAPGWGLTLLPLSALFGDISDSTAQAASGTTED